jgi:hypothetical protein
MKVYLGAEGLERVATGNTLYAWHYLLCFDDQVPPENGVEVGSFEPCFPTAAACVIPCLEMLQKREDELRDELNDELAKLTERRNALIMLEYSA